MALDFIAYKEDSSIPFVSIWERKINPSEILWQPEDSGKYSSNSYIVYVQYEGEDAPNVLFRGSVKGIYTSGKDDWVAETWRDAPFNTFQNKHSDIIKKIKATTRLKNNWNSYDAAKVSKETSYRAIKFLYELFRALNKRNISLPKPFAVACPDGSIQFEWEKEKRELEVVIPYSEGEKINLLQTEGDEYKEGFVSNSEEFIEYLIWLNQEE